MTDAELLALIKRKRIAGQKVSLRSFTVNSVAAADRASREYWMADAAIVRELKRRGGKWLHYELTPDGLNFLDTTFKMTNVRWAEEQRAKRSA